MTSDVRFSVEPFKNCEADVIAFRNRNRSIQRDHGYFRWRYVDRPSGHDALIVWGIDANGTKVASASVIPHEFHVLDRVHAIGVVGDISVLPECRGQRIGARLLAFMNDRPEMKALHGCFVLPNDEAAHSLQRAHWVEVPPIRRHVRLLDVGSRLTARLGDSWPVRLSAHAANLFLRSAVLGRSTTPPPGYDFAEATAFDARHDALWAAVRKEGRILAVRDRRYLQWRYGDHPAMQYRIFECGRGGQLCAYLVLHVLDDMVVVDDFLAVDDRALDALILQLLGRATRERWAAGFQLRFAGASRFAPKPAQLHFSERADTQRVMITPGFGTRPAAQLGNADAWFVTAGDKDV